MALNPEEGQSIEQSLAPIAVDLESLGIASLRIVKQSVIPQAANWKLLIEGGLEAYHFKVAHRNTIRPYFENNLSTYQVFGDHIHSVLPRTTLAAAKPTDSSFQLRDHANIAYWLAPNAQMLVQQDHIVWMQTGPVSPTETGMRLVTLAPASSLADKEHWEKNHHITLKTLREDFEIGTRIQESVGSGIEQTLIFGRFESALSAFNDIIERHLHVA